MSAPKITLKERVEAALKTLLDLPRRLARADESLSDNQRRMAAVFVFLQLFIEAMMARRITQRAAGLTYHTALSIVPVMVLFFAVAGSIGLLDNATEDIMDLIFTTWIPVSEPWLREGAENLLSSASKAYLGSVGLLIFLWTAIGLFNETEHLINDIWQIRERRTFGRRILIFWTLITVAPPLLTLSMVVTGRLQYLVQTTIGGLPFIELLGVWLFPILLTAFGLLVAYQLLPNTKVRWLHAGIAALITSTLLEIGKGGFAFYVSQFASVSWFRIYGAVFLIPVLLLWIYLSWVIIGSGALLTCNLQRWQHLKRAGDPRQHRLNRGIPMLAPLEIAAALTRSFLEGDGGMTTAALSDETNLIEGDAHQLLKLMERDELIERSSGPNDESAPWYWRRPPSDIQVVTVLRACGFFDKGSGEPDATLDALSANIESSIGELSLSELVQNERGG